jgi:dipeptidyl aminopeptidase/acylaminoacyl peptidase
LQELGAPAHFDLNPEYASGVFGKYIVGVRDSLTKAPEIAIYDRVSKKTTTLTDLNPQLRRRMFGQVSRIFWRGADGSDGHFGYLIKPVVYTSGKRYPLVILLKDESYNAEDNSFIIDGQKQLGGFAAQMLANEGIMVLFTPDPLSGYSLESTPREVPNMMAHVESGITYLDRLGLIDPQRVGISGWSRAAMYTDYIIAHSKQIRFAAASDVDGGGNYQHFMLHLNIANPKDILPDNQVDLHLRDVHTPLMSEEHGIPDLLTQSQLIGDLEALQKPVELYYYPNAPHNLKAPLQRYASLTRNIDWFRFWLQGYEDPNPRKAEQYAYWRKLRALQNADMKTASSL